MTTKPIIKFLEEQVFHIFGVPETLLTDNGVQFRSKEFSPFLDKYGVRHVYTGLYAPQSNASERVNRSLIAGIRAYIKGTKHNDWDQHLSAISCALRSSLHHSIGQSPYHLLFGQEMITNGSSYAVLRRLHSLEEGAEPIRKDDRLMFYRDQAKKIIAKSFEVNAARYNLRSRENKLAVGQRVFRRNFALSDQSKGFNAKLAPKFVAARVIEPIGNTMYKLQDEVDQRIGVYHTQHIKT